jgi:glycosyltransferase involved in cell wall biosynthesis
MKNGSVILAFYNDLPLLRTVLDSLNDQYSGQFEVLIADDGSKSEVVTELKALLPKYPFKCQHLWHPDHGFRKVVIMNQAVLAAKTNHLIFMDADCVPQRHFVNDHLRSLRPGVYQAGRRIDAFYEGLTELRRTPSIRLFTKHWLRFFLWSARGKARNVEKGIRLPYALAKRLPSGRPWSLVGCNFSVCKEDLLAVNGFDERADVQWGAEDSDIDRRLLQAGLKRVNLRYQATMIHFDSSYFKRSAMEATRPDQVSIFKQAQTENRTWTRHGILKEDRPDLVLYQQV